MKKNSKHPTEAIRWNGSVINNGWDKGSPGKRDRERRRKEIEPAFGLIQQIFSSSFYFAARNVFSRAKVKSENQKKTHTKSQQFAHI